MNLRILLVALALGLVQALSVSQPYRVVGLNGTARLRCLFTSSPEPEEMRVSLLKGLHGQEEVCGSYVSAAQAAFQARGTLGCSGELSAGRVDLRVEGLRGDDTELYRCVVEVLYPPPYLRRSGNGTLVYVPDIVQPACPKQAAEVQYLAQKEDQETPGSSSLQVPFPLVAAIALLMVICIIYQIAQITQRRRDTLTVRLKNSAGHEYGNI
ncbi:cytotoxic T-lymphocyte protein 4 [Denticeps clupeoides]|uniref:cytotoxic T-lymphocyte protein 4 n=1 Tax=Denticeps clupeoides TaxID=299321 RepID=UPI0010A30A35|nr:cytotoxic T-lymphocyte protein 4-like [Denticeps clupeoides]